MTYTGALIRATASSACSGSICAHSETLTCTGKKSCLVKPLCIATVQSCGTARLSAIGWLATFMRELQFIQECGRVGLIGLQGSAEIT